MMKTLTYASAVMVGVIFLSCDFNDNVAPFATNTKTPIFFLLFAVNGDQKVDVDFSTNSMSIIPYVTVNGDTLKTSIDFHDGIIRGELRNLKFNKTYKYAVAVNNNKTSGEIAMPTIPKNIKCNDTLLVEKQMNFLHKSDSIRFSWCCDSFDHFWFDLECNSLIQMTTKDTSIAFATDGSYHYKMNMVSVSGPGLKPGARPNVTGGCGDGFVLGISKEVEFNVWFDGIRLIKGSDQPRSPIKEKIKFKLIETLIHDK